MPDNPVALTVAGSTYRVTSSLPTEQLLRLARALDDRIQAFNLHGELTHNQALLYAALALTHDLEQERDGRRKAQAATRQALLELLDRVDVTLAQLPTPDGSPAPTQIATEPDSPSLEPSRAKAENTDT